MAFEIYKVTHRASGKTYVGCTIRGIEFRWQCHIYSANHSKGKALHSAIAKYGAEAFDVTLVATATSSNEMFSLERKFIADFNTMCPNGYNMTSGGDGVYDPLPEVRKRIRERMLGNKNFLGRRHSEETKALMSVSAKRSQEHRAAISKAQKGKVLSIETRAKISVAKIGFSSGPCSEQRRANISLSKLNAPRGSNGRFVKN